MHTYRCACAAGYTAGWCDYAYVSEYSAPCKVQESGGQPSANCDVDVDECVSEPCANRATCSDSTKLASIPEHAYRCTCTAGFANGVCEYGHISEYSQQCSVQDSSGAAGGNCDADVDECASRPCKNGAKCSESTTEASLSDHAYKCTCATGYTNGWCEYAYISEYNTQCTISESSEGGGNCDTDVDECKSFPCQNEATCVESSNSMHIDAYECTCVTGYVGEHCTNDVNECSSKPCQNGAFCNTTNADVDVYSCSCVEGCVIFMRL